MSVTVASTETVVLTPHQQDVYLDRYALRGPDGEPIETCIEETWRRVAHAVAQAEPDQRVFDDGRAYYQRDEDVEHPGGRLTAREYWEDRFYSILEGFKFLPGGRILAGAGSGHAVSLMNCFCLDLPEDSRGGIIQRLGESVEIMSHGGGFGINLSSLRPRGSYIKTVNGHASGPVPWAEFFSQGVATVGGSRMGAAMLLLDIRHPDVEEFIVAKDQPGCLEHANLSVAISDEFMEAVKYDREWYLTWPLTPPGEVVALEHVQKTVQAREFWRKIAEHAWQTGDPGIVFLERANKESNTWYCDPIVGTTDCLGGNSLVLTTEGLVPISELAGKEFVTWGDGYWRKSRAWLAGREQIHRLRLSNGLQLEATIDHMIRLLGTDVPVVDAAGCGVIPPLGQGWPGGDDLGLSEDQWALLGFIQGDGSFRHDCDAITVNVGVKDLDVAVKLPPGCAWHGERTAYYHQDHEVVAWTKAVGLIRRPLPERPLPRKLFTATTDAVKAFLRGLYSANGSVISGERIALKSTCRQLVGEVQVLLGALGIPSYITTNKAKPVAFANGTYECRESYDLNIIGRGARRFMGEIGFIQLYKRQALRSSVGQRQGKRRPAKVVAIEEIGSENVYAFAEPEARHGWVNGLEVHSCVLSWPRSGNQGTLQRAHGSPEAHWLLGWLAWSGRAGFSPGTW